MKAVQMLGPDEDFRQMLRACCVGRLEPVVDSVRDLDEAEDALERMEAGEQFGKLVLRV
jgi:NADPH:quinone reductase-like Zn-dependent oxidoreductase